MLIARHELVESGLGTILNSCVTLIQRGGVGGGGKRRSEASDPLSDRPRQRPRQIEEGWSEESLE